jgi:hypothetical protein
MFGWFRPKKVKEAEKLKFLLLSEQITYEDYKSRLYDIDRDLWFQSLSSTEKKLHDINLSYNKGMLNKDEYLEKLKELDPKKWASMVDDVERTKYELTEQLNTGKLSKNEYEKEIKTLDKEPYIHILNIEYNVKDGIHAIEFDWNEYFIKELKENGYSGKTDEEIIDQWFVALSTLVASESDSVIVTDPEDLRKIRKKDKQTEYY